MPRPARPDDLFRLAVPFDPVLVARRPARRVQRQAHVRRATTATAIRCGWPRPTARRPPARSPSAAARDRYPRFSPDGRTLAFISDRRLLVEEEPDRPKEAKDRLDCDQVFLLPLDGGEARRLTDLPRGANEFAWSPDGRWLAVRLELARGDDRGGVEEARPARRAEARRDAAVRLPLHRPARLPVQRYGLRRRPRRAPVARRRRDRRGAIARQRADPGGRARVESGRHPDRLHGQPAAPPGPRPAFVGVHRGCRERRGHDDRGRPGRRRSCGPCGPATAARSSRSATGSRGWATGAGSGGSRPTGRTRAGVAARTSSRRAS